MLIGGGTRLYPRSRSTPHDIKLQEGAVRQVRTSGAPGFDTVYQGAWPSQKRDHDLS